MSTTRRQPDASLQGPLSTEYAPSVVGEKLPFSARNFDSVEFPSGPQTDDPAYNTVHSRLYKSRGRACLQRCIACGAKAWDWAYNHEDPDERHAPNGAPYSVNPEFYVPMCRLHHIRTDCWIRKKQGVRAKRQQAKFDLAKQLEPEIRNAVAERKAARDPDAKAHWDDELDRLYNLLTAPHPKM